MGRPSRRGPHAFGVRDDRHTSSGFGGVLFALLAIGIVSGRSSARAEDSAAAARRGGSSYIFFLPGGRSTNHPTAAPKVPAPPAPGRTPGSKTQVREAGPGAP